MLVPEDIRWIPANTEGRVEKEIVVWPSTHVEADTIILELSSPELEQAAHDPALQATGAEAELTTLNSTLQRELLEQEATTAKAKSDYEQAVMERQANDQSAKNGLIAELQYNTSKLKEAELANRNEIEQERLSFAHEAIDPRLAPSKQRSIKPNTLLRESSTARQNRALISTTRILRSSGLSNSSGRRRMQIATRRG